MDDFIMNFTEIMENNADICQHFKNGECCLDCDNYQMCLRRATGQKEEKEEWKRTR